MHLVVETNDRLEIGRDIVQFVLSDFLLFLCVWSSACEQPLWAHNEDPEGTIAHNAQKGGQWHTMAP